MTGIFAAFGVVSTRTRHGRSAKFSGFISRGSRTYADKTLFAQIMDFLPWTSFRRIVQRYGGDHRARILTCAEQFRVMAFAQLTYRESRTVITHPDERLGHGATLP